MERLPNWSVTGAKLILTSKSPFQLFDSAYITIVILVKLVSLLTADELHAQSLCDKIHSYIQYTRKSSTKICAEMLMIEVLVL